MEKLIFLPLIIALANPADFSGKTMYPSGIKEIDGEIFHDYKPNTNLTISIPESNKIQAGFYNVIVTDNYKYVYLSQNNGVGYFLPIVKTFKPLTQNQYKSVEISTVNQVKLIIYRDFDYEYYALFD